MSEKNHGVSFGPLPLIIGITGHRNLRPEDVPALETKVRNEFSAIRSRYPYTPLVLLSPLAEGADRLVARVGLQMGITLHVPLPMPRAIYVTDFNEAAMAEFVQLEQQAEQVLELPLVRGNSAESVQRPGDARNHQYDAVGEHIAKHSQILFALWDGQPATKKGGTADIVQWRLTELPAASATLLHAPDPVLSGPVVQIVTPRQGHPMPAEPFSVVKHFPKALQHSAVPEETFSEIFAQIDAFNHEVVQKANPAGLQQSRTYLFPDEKALQLSTVMRRTRDCFASADLLSGNNQRQSFISFKWILAFVFASVVIYEIFEQVLSMFAYAMLSYPTLLSLAYSVYYWAKWQDYQNKYQDYRALAEGLRVQFFWRLAGHNDSVESHYLRKHRAELNWIRTALRVHWALNGGEYSCPCGNSTQPDDRMSWVLQHWIDDQLGFFQRRAESETHKHEQLERKIKFGLGIGIAMSVSFGVLFVTLYNNVHHVEEWFHHNRWAEGILIVLTSLPLLTGMVIHAFVQYRALEQQARQYKVMAKLLGAARSLWQSMTLSSAGEPSTRSLRELVNELGKEALMENADWVMLHRDRPLEVPHGK
jgi:hypothetical protein